MEEKLLRISESLICDNIIGALDVSRNILEENVSRDNSARYHVLHCSLILKSFANLKSIDSNTWREIQHLSENICSSDMDSVNALRYLEGRSSLQLGDLDRALRVATECDGAETSVTLPHFGSLRNASVWKTLKHDAEKRTTQVEQPKRVSKKNWDAIEKEIEKELKEEEETIAKSGGDASLQQLLKSIYQNSDDDTRRAMVKSMQTSEGTVLSTNWKEVRARDFTKEIKEKKQKDHQP